MNQKRHRSKFHFRHFIVDKLMDQIHCIVVRLLSIEKQIYQIILVPNEAENLLVIVDRNDRKRAQLKWKSTTNIIYIQRYELLYRSVSTSNECQMESKKVDNIKSVTLFYL